MATVVSSGAATPAAREQVAARALPGLDPVAPADWDALVVDGSGPLSYGYLSAWEKVELRGLCSRPVIAHRGTAEEPLAACPGYLYDLDVATVRSPRSSHLAETMRRLWPRFLFIRTYELGSPTPLTRPFLVADEAVRPQAVRALIEAGLDAAERGGASFVLVQNFPSRTGPAADELARLGFAGVPTPPTAVVDLPYETFDDYLGAMRSQYRRRARQTLSRSDDLTPERLDRFEDLAEELARLWRLVYERASEIKREIYTAEFFAAVSKLEESSVLLLRRADGSIASFALLLAEHRWLSFLQCGFEADAGRREGAYFRLLYEIVRTGIEGGFDQLDLGMTTLAPKLDVGAVPVPLFAWIRHRNPVVQRAIRLAARHALRPPDVEPRRVFKNAPRSAEELVASRLLPG